MAREGVAAALLVTGEIAELTKEVSAIGRNVNQAVRAMNAADLILIPRKGDFEVSVVLGERAVALALAGDLPADTKRQLSEARQYAEGRGIRFPVTKTADVATARRLVAFKVAPK